MLAHDLSDREVAGAAALGGSRAPADLADRARATDHRLGDVAGGHDSAVAHDHVVKVSLPSLDRATACEAHHGSMDVAAAFRAVDRGDFLRPADRRNAAYDGPIPIGHGQTNSQPRTVRAMLMLLDVGPGHRVLDVGSGSGWTTALLAHLVGPEGSVLGLERVEDLVTFGAEN